MESNIAALRAKNDAEAARQLLLLRADTLEGLRYAHSEIESGEHLLGHNDGRDSQTLRDAIKVIEERWPA